MIRHLANSVLVHDDTLNIRPVSLAGTLPCVSPEQLDIADADLCGLRITELGLELEFRLRESALVSKKAEVGGNKIRLNMTMQSCKRHCQLRGNPRHKGRNASQTPMRTQS